MTNITNITNITDTNGQATDWSVPWIILSTYVVVGWGKWSFEANLTKTMLILWNLTQD